MPQGSDYIFAIQSQDHRFWKVVDRKVTVNAQPYFLDFAPAGWADIAVQNIRNKKYWGIDRTVTIPLTYVQDGAQILKYIFLNKGIEEPLYLVILEQQLDYEPGIGYTYWYKQRFRGEFDLSTYNHEGSTVKVTTLEDGLPKYLKANENTTIEFPMDVAEAINVKMDGIQLRENLKYRDIDGIDFSGVTVGTNGFTPTFFIAAEGDHYGVDVNSQNLQNVTALSYTDKLLQTNCLIQNFNSTPLVCTISGRVEFTCTNQTSPAWSLRIRYLKSNLPIGNQNDYQVFSTGMTVGNTYGQDFSITVTLNQGERLYREGVFFGGISGNPAVVFTENSQFSISFISRKETTYIKAFRPQYLFSKLIDHITEGNYSAAVSDYFDRFNGHGRVVFTCGNAIRGFSDALMKINWNDFFKFWDCYSSVGIIETGKEVDIADKQDLIDLTTIVDLAEPTNLSLSVATDFLYNELEIGWPEVRNDVGALNGNEEFNTRFLFSMGTTRRPARMDKISKIGAGCYSVEKIRTTTINKDTTDYKSDNDVFALYLANPVLPTIVPGVGDVWELDRSVNASASGLIEPDSVFNIPLSPHSNLNRNKRWLRSCTWLMDGRFLKYQSSDKNNKVEFTDPLFGPVIEKADENIGGMGDQFFVPLVMNITIPAPNDLIGLLDANPLQVYRFPFYGDYYMGIIQKVSTGLASNKEQQWELLPLPTTNLKKLEDYYG